MSTKQRVNQFKTRFAHLVRGKGWVDTCNFEDMKSCSYCRKGFEEWREAEGLKSLQGSINYVVKK